MLTINDNDLVAVRLAGAQSAQIAKLKTGKTLKARLAALSMVRHQTRDNPTAEASVARIEHALTHCLGYLIRDGEVTEVPVAIESHSENDDERENGISHFLGINQIVGRFESIRLGADMLYVPDMAHPGMPAFRVNGHTFFGTALIVGETRGVGYALPRPKMTLAQAKAMVEFPNAVCEQTPTARVFVL
jgi:hypothetical protein